MRSPPLLYFVVAIAGALLGLSISIDAFSACLVLATTVFAALLIRVRPLKALLVCAVLGIFVATLASFEHSRFRELLEKLPSDSVLFEGKVLDLSDTLNGDRIGFMQVDRTSARINSNTATFRISIRFTGAASAKPVRIGDVIRVKGKILKAQHALSPGQVDGYWFGLSRGIHGRLVVSDPRLVAILQQKPNLSPIDATKQALKNQLVTSLSPREAGLLLALIVGDIKLFDDDQQSQYRNIGAGHLLAVSGLQISILSVIFYRTFLFLFLLVPWISRRSLAQIPTTIVALLLIWSFVALCGAPPSAMRAALMSTLVLLARLIAWPTRSVDVFGAAGLISVLNSPSAVVDPSFWLSYAAVFGLIMAAEIPFYGNSDVLLDPTQSWSQWTTKIRGVLVGSLGAGVLTLPFSAFYFSELSPTGLVVNIFLVPIAGFLQTPAILLATAGAILHLPFLTSIAAFFAGVLDVMCMTLNDWSGKTLVVTAPSSWSLFLLVVACIFVIWSSGRMHRIQKLSFAVLCATLATMPYWFKNRDFMAATFLPVGQGDSAVIESPSGKVIVIDGGGNHDDSFNPGERVVSPFLRRRGVDTIDVIVLSHPDADHLMGLLPLIENFKVKEIWHSGFDASHPLMAKLIQVASRRGVRLRSIHELPESLNWDDARIELLAPKDESGVPKIQTTNNRSLVLRVSYRDHSILFPGDIEELRELDLLKKRFDLHATIVKAPHHGSQSSSSEEFVQATGARHVVFCTGVNNRFGFPHAQVVKRWQRNGASLWNTAVNGETAFHLGSEAVEVKPFISTTQDES